MPTIDPEEVRFSQGSVQSLLRDGRTIDELAEGLRAGTINPEKIPPIRLVKRGERLFTLDILSAAESGTNCRWLCIGINC